MWIGSLCPRMFWGTRATNCSIYTTKIEGAGPQILGNGAKFKRVPCQKSCRVNRAYKSAMQVPGRLNFHWVKAKYSLGRVSLGLLRRVVLLARIALHQCRWLLNRPYSSIAVESHDTIHFSPNPIILSQSGHCTLSGSSCIPQL